MQPETNNYKVNFGNIFQACATKGALWFCGQGLDRSIPRPAMAPNTQYEYSREEWARLWVLEKGRKIHSCRFASLLLNSGGERLELQAETSAISAASAPQPRSLRTDKYQMVPVTQDAASHQCLSGLMHCEQHYSIVLASFHASLYSRGRGKNYCRKIRIIALKGGRSRLGKS